MYKKYIPIQRIYLLSYSLSEQGHITFGVKIIRPCGGTVGFSIAVGVKLQRGKWQRFDESLENMNGIASC